jgi:hypothetical protein
MFVFVLVLVIAALAVFIYSQPDEFRISRNAAIYAPVHDVFEQVNDLHKWQAWSPWAKLDPNASNTFEGPQAGMGSSMEWNGNSKVGAGKMTVTHSKPYELIQMKLEFFRPFKAVNQTVFTFAPNGNHTQVSWTMTGRSNFVGKAMNLIMNCDKMVGGQFEQGLNNMRAAVKGKDK